MAEEKKTGKFERQLKVRDLIETHEEYDNNASEWIFTMALYEGIREVIRLQLIKQHERESDRSYARRIEELYGFGYSKSVIEIFHFYLFKKEIPPKLGDLAEDELYTMFTKDADQYGNDLNAVEMEFALYAAIQGHVGILVDKPTFNGQTRQQQRDQKAYPYLAIYRAPSILDWEWGKDKNRRPKLMRLKLLDEDKTYRIWTPTNWEIWELPKDEGGNYTKSNEEQDAVFVDSGEHKIGEIPFIWHYNLKSKTRNIGQSDIHEVSRIDLSIIRNCSQVEGIINFAAFPMMRKPQRDARPTEVNTPQQDDEVGVEVILEFDPEHPDSKPDWLEAVVAEPINATGDFIDRKVGEIYRACNIGGLAATEPTKQNQSGVAKRIDFQLLNSKLVSKATNMEDTENRIYRYWLLWEGSWDKYKDKIKITRDKQFDIEAIAEDLENALTAKTLVISDKFKELLQKQTARQMLPSISEKDLDIIDKEIEENVAKEDDFSSNDGFISDDDLDPETKALRDKAMNGNNFNKKQNTFPPQKNEDKE